MDMRALGRVSIHSAVAMVLRAVLLVLLLTACGGETDSSGLDSETTEEATDEVDGGEVLDAEVVAILSGTAAGGSADPQRVVRLDEPGGVDELTAGLSRQLPADIRQVVDETEVPEGRALVGAVVTIGCDVPSGLLVGSDPIHFKPTWTGVTRLQECFAPVTSVGIVLVDSSLVES